MAEFEKIYKSSEILRKFERNVRKFLKQAVSEFFSIYFESNSRKQNYVIGNF